MIKTQKWLIIGKSDNYFYQMLLSVNVDFLDKCMRGKNQE